MYNLCAWSSKKKVIIIIILHSLSQQFSWEGCLAASCTPCSVTGAVHGALHSHQRNQERLNAFQRPLHLQAFVQNIAKMLKSSIKE